MNYYSRQNYFMLNQIQSNQISRRIFYSILIGIIAGTLLHFVNAETYFYQIVVHQLLDWGGKAFINLLKMLVVPVVFVSLVTGTFGMEHSGRFGAIALKTVSLYLFTTAIAIVFSLSIASFLGISASSEQLPVLNTPIELDHLPSVKDTLLNIVPSNPFQAFADGNMLQIIVFALLFGIAINLAKEQGQRLRKLFISANDVVMELVHLIFFIAPIGIFCLIAKLFADIGFSLILDLLGYFLGVILVLLLQLFLVYPVLLQVTTRLSPLVFFKKMWAAMLFAFSTSSSNASIPVVLETVETKLGVDPSTAAFVIPLGATINMDGTTIMQGVATIFIANSYHIPLNFSQLLIIVLLTILASIGTAGVPSVGLITLTMVLSHVGLPVEGIALIIGIDRILDMSRTAVNICGDSVIALIISHSEGHHDQAVYYSAER